MFDALDPQPRVAKCCESKASEIADAAEASLLASMEMVLLFASPGLVEVSSSSESGARAGSPPATRESDP